MMKKILAMTAMLVLAAAPLALAHDGHSNTKDKAIPGPNPHCWPTQNPHDYGAPGSVRADIMKYARGVGFASVSDYNTEDCDNHVISQDPATPGDADFDGDFEYGTGGGFFPAGFWANEPTCERGYVNHHHTDVHVHDAIWPYDKNDPQISALHNAVSFSVGADPSPPTVVTVPPIVIPGTIDPDGIPDSGDEIVIPGTIDPDNNPDTEPNVVIPDITIDPDGVPDSGDEIVILPLVISEGSTECVDDGCICPGLADADDWIKPCIHKCPIFPAPPEQAANPSYGEPGGDGGFWVFVNCNVSTDGDAGIVDKNNDRIPENGQDKDNDGDPDNIPGVDRPITPPTQAGGTCSVTGHIYFPNEWPGKN